jgi:tRNA(fMet)-specific endonuclease VapC
MKYLLDTNICIYLIKNKPESVALKLKEIDITDIGISSVTTAELYFGVNKSSKKEQNQSALNTFLLPFEILNFDEKDSFIYGTIRAELERTGFPIGAMDLLIASQAMSRELTLVTNNTYEFQRVKGLRIENWV